MRLSVETDGEALTFSFVLAEEVAKTLARVPCSDIGVSSGDTIRLVVREADATYDAASFFPEIMLTLK